MAEDNQRTGFHITGVLRIDLVRELTAVVLTKSVQIEAHQSSSGVQVVHTAVIDQIHDVEISSVRGNGHALGIHRCAAGGQHQCGHTPGERRPVSLLAFHDITAVILIRMIRNHVMCVFYGFVTAHRVRCQCRLLLCVGSCPGAERQAECADSRKQSSDHPHRNTK